MKLLALDTSSDACSVALQLDNEVRGQHVVKAKEHTNILLPMIKSVLRDASVELQDLDAIVLGNGPGSFIGMRIAASVAQGLAFGSGLKIVPVSSMAAVAAEVFDAQAAEQVVVAQDARMNEVYFGIYRPDNTGLGIAKESETLQKISKINELNNDPMSVAAGQAWHKYPELLQLNRTAISAVAEVLYPNAKYLLGLGGRAWQSGEANEPVDLVPAYIRMTVAEKPEPA